MKEELRKGFRIGVYLIDPLTGVIEGPDGGQRIQPKVVEVLLCLAESQGELVEREELHQKIWGKTIVSDDAVTRCISELRRAFNDMRDNPQYIQTLPKRGYRLLKPIESDRVEYAQKNNDGQAVPNTSSWTIEPPPGTRWDAEGTFSTPQALAKQPLESRMFSFNFGPRLAQGETIISVDAIHQHIIDQESGQKSASSDLELQKPAVDQQVIRLRISGGQNQTLYKITFLVTISNDDTVEGEGLLLVFDI